MNNMKILALLGLLSFPAISQAQDSYTLADCFEASLNRSETVAIQRELILQTEEQYKQGIGRILPEVSGEASYFRQQNSQTGTSFNRNTEAIAKITATQPIFRGFREFAFLRETKNLKAGKNLDMQNATLQLYQDVASNFYAIISLEKEINNVEEQIDLFQKRIQELHARQRIGRSKPSEVLTVQASLANLAAQKEEITGRLLPEREVFFFLTGLPHHALLQDTEEIPQTFPSLDDYLEKIENRPDLRAEQERVKAASEAVSVARGAHSPALDAKGNYYFVHTDSLSDPDRQANWDAQITLSVPIFSGGALQSKVRESRSQKRQAELVLQQKRKAAEEEIRSLHQRLSSNLAQVKAYQQAKELSERNYQVQSKDYRNGLVTNLDVLAALTSLQETKRDLIRTLYGAKLNFIRLESAVVKRPDLGSGKKSS